MVPTKLATLLSSSSLCRVNGAHIVHDCFADCGKGAVRSLAFWVIRLPKALPIGSSPEGNLERAEISQKTNANGRL
ncbi:MAG: hypothetical protein L3J67_06125 [Hyphomicrobiaceae bacterium]|nr:hypothetical protein [Hyphomicrobiaceae bacterium]